MNVASPCIGTCKLDATTGWCLGCARSGEEIASWRAQTAAWRSDVWDALPNRLVRLGVTCRRLPWETREVRDFVVRSLHQAAGTWVIGVVGAVAEFTAKPGADIEVAVNGDAIEAVTEGGHLRFLINDDVRALTFDWPDESVNRQRVVLAVKKERGGPTVSDTLVGIGADQAAMRPEDRAMHVFDLGLGRTEARFCVRCVPGASRDVLTKASGLPMMAALPQIGPALVQESPDRIVESALGRIEVMAPIPAPGGVSPVGSHTHLLPDHLATGRALPLGMDLPDAYLPGAIFYPAE